MSTRRRPGGKGSKPMPSNLSKQRGARSATPDRMRGPGGNLYGLNNQKQLDMDPTEKYSFSGKKNTSTRGRKK